MNQVKVKVAVVFDSLPSMDYIQSMDSSCQDTGVGSLSLLQGIFPTQGSEPRSPTLQVDSLSAEPQRKSKNTGVGS